MYGPVFYATRKGWASRAAARILPSVFEIVRPASLIDIGCGTGTWLREAKRLGVARVRGVDGPWVRESSLDIPTEDFAARDLEKPLGGEGRFDLAMSLEVAEHLSPSHAAAFVGNLCELAPVVLFSAAIPGQGGQHHVNEQWPSYWTELFRAHDYELFDVIRPAVWDDESVPYWYRQNILLFAGPEAPAEVRERLLKAAEQGTFGGADLVHPEHSQRALQYPGLWPIVKAFPFALVRSLTAARDAIKEKRVAAAVACLAGIALFGAFTIKARPTELDAESEAYISNVFEATRRSDKAELVLFVEEPGPDKAQITSDLEDDDEDFFVVSEENLEEIERLDTDRRLLRVARIGDVHLFQELELPGRGRPVL